MSDQPIPLSRRVALLKAAVARIRHAEEQRDFALANGMPGRAKQYAEACVAFAEAEMEFRFYWREVEALLTALDNPRSL